MSTNPISADSSPVEDFTKYLDEISLHKEVTKHLGLSKGALKKSAEEMKNFLSGRVSYIKKCKDSGYRYQNEKVIRLAKGAILLKFLFEKKLDTIERINNLIEGMVNGERTNEDASFSKLFKSLKSNDQPMSDFIINGYKNEETEGKISIEELNYESYFQIDQSYLKGKTISTILESIYPEDQSTKEAKYYNKVFRAAAKPIRAIKSMEEILRKNILIIKILDNEEVLRGNSEAINYLISD